MTPCPWCPQPEGHVGVCGPVAVVTRAPAVETTREQDEESAQVEPYDAEAEDLRAQRSEERELKGE